MNVAYVDTSALVKLVVIEAETAALRTWIGRLDGAAVVATSGLTLVELLRASRRHGPAAVTVAERVLAATQTIAMTPVVLRDAAVLEPPTLRSLDAIHLATARAIGSSLTAFVAYDTRLLDAASAAGLPVVTPR